MPSQRRVFERVVIVDTGHKGVAIGKTTDGRTVMVEGVVPGDIVDVVAIR
jgi:23S rRNA (uracil1939-C5)-methyltransferase